MPITFVFGELDEFSKYEYSKELMYEIKSEKNVQFVKDFVHDSFNGAELNDQL